ncbi:nuclear transport factor 2 family protein [Undibacterium sp.]|uniref:nuclear transport factor 2 family protein n=1 Tax=Undibacterium sp. TaxID=1914977 RepID=UPI00374DAF93
MPILLPPPLDAYVKASNNGDSAAAAACFAADAVVHDEGHAYTGVDAIRAWRDETLAKYGVVLLDPTALTDSSESPILTATCSGNFDGSPVPLHFHFTVRQGKITALRISA